MKCFWSLFLMFGCLSSSLCTPSHAQHSGCGAYGPEPATCPFRSQGQKSAYEATMSPWGLSCWLTVKPPAKVEAAADSSAEAYAGCEAGCPDETYGCAAARSAVVRDVWSELYTRDCCPEAARDDATDEAVAADVASATESDLGCLAADERHSRGQATVESLNTQQQGLSGTHLTVRLRIGPVTEDDAFNVTPELPSPPVAALPSACFDDEETCSYPYYDCLGADGCHGEFDYDCRVEASADAGCDAAADQSYGDNLHADDMAPAVARRSVIRDDLDDRFVDDILRQTAPLATEIIREDLAAPVWPTPEPWANEVIDQANGQSMCRSLLATWAVAARCGGECLRSLSHSLNELADDMGQIDEQQAALPPFDPDFPTDETESDTSYSIPDEYLGW